jgi:integrase/recombinase XerD
MMSLIYGRSLAMTTLRQRMRDDLQLRNYAPLTIDCYLRCVAHFAQHFRTPPDRLGPEHIRQYQLYLIQERHLSWSRINQVVSALRFFYRITLKQPWMIEFLPHPKRPNKLPTLLSPAEVAALLQAPRELKSRAILTTLYAAGLRVSELCHLHVPDIDSARMVLRIQQGKGQQDRYVMLAPQLLSLLREYWREAKPRLWLFPGAAPARPLTRKTVYLLCRRAGVRAHLGKAVHPHMLHHAFASHLVSSMD